MEERRFDELTRAIAQSTSRRRVLKGLVAAVAGAALSSIGLGAQAQGNSNAAHFCDTVFSPGPERGKCISDAAHGTGLFYQCQGNPANVCQDSNSATCPDFSNDANHCGSCGNVCPSDQPCLDGTCGCASDQTMCGGNCIADCDPALGQVLDPVTCQCGCPSNRTLCGGTCIATCDAYLGQVLDTTTCQCVCPEGYLMLGNGYCIRSCTEDADCGDFRTCDTTTEGDRVCSSGGYLPFCSPCTSTQGCQSGPGSCQAVNTYCSATDHLCH
jgi:hypothetical protein